MAITSLSAENKSENQSIRHGCGVIALGRIASWKSVDGASVSLGTLNLDHRTLTSALHIRFDFPLSDKAVNICRPTCWWLYRLFFFLSDGQCGRISGLSNGERWPALLSGYLLHCHRLPSMSHESSMDVTAVGKC